MKLFFLILCLAVFIPNIHGQEMNKRDMLDLPLKLDKNELNSILDPAFNDNNYPDYKLNFNIMSDSAMYADIPDSVSNKSEEYQRLYRLFGSYSDFKRKFLALKVDDKVPEMNLMVSKYLTVQALNPYYSDRVVFIVDGPISFFYKKFNKHGQSEQKYADLKKYEPKQQEINRKYNTQNIQHWTGLQGDKLTKFVLYCHFSDEYLFRATEYELIESVFAKLKEFKALADTSSKKVQIVDSCN
jgi:hypothetical protein